jgi:hypothetical protein
MDVSLNNRVKGKKHRAKGMGKGHLQCCAIEMSHSDSKGSSVRIRHVTHVTDQVMDHVIGLGSV